MEYKVALNKAMAICSRSEHCAYDILQKLEKWNVEDKERVKVIDALYKDNFIDDDRFAEAYVKDKFRFNGWGRIKISYMLRQKGLVQATINNALEIINNEEYIELLQTEIEKKLAKTNEDDKYKLKAKVLRYAASRGFEQDLIFKVLGKIGLD